MRAIDRYNLLLALLLMLLLWLNQQPAHEPQPLLDVAAAEVSEIRVLRDGQLQLSLLRDDDGWMLTHPDVARASAQRAASLLGLLQAESHWQTGAQASTLQTYGLQQPRLSVHFDEQVLHFGSASTPPGQRYILVNGQVHLIDEAYFRIAGLPAKHFRERR
jgi:hypothetical protein